MTRDDLRGPPGLSAPLQTLPGIGPVRSRQLAEAGCETLGDLLGHLPHRYEDRTTIVPVARALELAEEGAVETVTVRGHVESVRRVRVRRRGLSLVRGLVRDPVGASPDVEPPGLPVLWFNRPYLARWIDPDTEYLLHGPIRRRKSRETGSFELLNPSCERVDGAVHGGRIVPVYPSLGPLGPATVRRLVARALEALDDGASPERAAWARIPEPLPDEVLNRQGIPALGPALWSLHLPGSGGAEPDVEALQERTSPAHRRLIYGELLEQQLALSVLRAGRSVIDKGRRYDDRERTERARRTARAVLPFRLTEAQRQALAEVTEDLRRPEPMARLLQGDVGSGKTIVAVMALILALEHGYQGAFMAPTELLAEQHFRRLSEVLGARYRIGLVAGANPELASVRRALATGAVDLAVGTHALIQEGVTFPRLGLAVIDEQHRFGVVQRRMLEAKGEGPDVLVMTATPIPRTLALTVFGDLDLSLIDELPPGRQPVVTEIRDAADREEIYGEVARRLAAGERVYVVFPRIEGGEGEASSLEEEGRWVRHFLAARMGGEDGVASVHGRMGSLDRERVMTAFAAGEVRCLLATTVIEVGVDVPEATVIVIEGAERFGLSQLHQLRGRVGRGERSARCVAVVGAREGLTDEGRARLETFAGITDGFEIAERDLEIRGFGELLGTRQAGLAQFRVADPVAHRDLLERAREDARELAGRLEEPGMEALRRRVERALERRRKMLEGGGGEAGREVEQG